MKSDYIYSDVERDVYVLATPGVETPELLRVLVIVLQRHHHSMLQMLLRLPQQEGVHQVRQIYICFHFDPSY